MALEFPEPTETIKVQIEKPLLAALKRAVDEHNAQKGAQLTVEQGASHYLNKALRTANGAPGKRRRKGDRPTES